MNVEITDIQIGGDNYYSESDNHGNFTMKRIINKKISLMCPHCFNLMHGHIKREVNLDSKIKFDTYVDVSDSYKFTVDECPFCNKKDMDLIELDENIAESISILNKKGYYTNFCCAGHIEDGKFKPGYIYFRIHPFLLVLYNNTPIDSIVEISRFLDIDKIINNIPIPKLWYVDKNDFKKQKFIIRQKKRKIGEKGLRNRIDSLKGWVESLPDLKLTI